VISGGYILVLRGGHFKFTDVIRFNRYFTTYIICKHIYDISMLNVWYAYYVGMYWVCTQKSFKTMQSHLLVVVQITATWWQIFRRLWIRRTTISETIEHINGNTRVHTLHVHQSFSAKGSGDHLMILSHILYTHDAPYVRTTY